MSAAEEDQDLVDYDEEEEEQNVAAEETADAEGKEIAVNLVSLKSKKSS